MTQPIDAVITWVDGNDPKLKQKQRKYFKSDESDDITSAARFADCNEIYYCISAIIKNAAFINRIFIVTDDQVPPVIAQIRDTFGAEAAARMIVVDHTDIFAGFTEYLPTFNSTTIEAMLHRIPDLSARYIYFNDDFIIAKPMTEADFFVGDRPVLRGKWRKMREIDFNTNQRQRMLDGRPYLRAKMFSYKEYQALAYKLLGHTDDFFWHDHTPHPFYRPDLEAFYDQNEDVLRKNIQFRTRDMSQFDTMSLANALDLEKGGSTIRKSGLTYLKASSKRFHSFYVWRKRISAEKHGSTFLCLQALNDTHPKARKAVFAWLDELLFS